VRRPFRSAVAHDVRPTVPAAAVATQAPRDGDPADDRHRLATAGAPRARAVASTATRAVGADPVARMPTVGIGRRAERRSAALRSARTAGAPTSRDVIHAP